METLNLDDIRVQLVNLYCVECKQAFPDIETFECHHDDDYGEDEDDDGDNKSKETDSEPEFQQIFQSKPNSRTRTRTTSNDNRTSKSFGGRGRPVRKKSKIDYSANDENVAPITKNSTRSKNNKVAVPTSSSTMANSGILDLMSVNFFELQDYLHCCRCFETFYTLPDLLAHFKNCNVKMNSTFTQFKRRGPPEPKQTSTNLNKNLAKSKSFSENLKSVPPPTKISRVAEKSSVERNNQKNKKGSETPPPPLLQISATPSQPTTGATIVKVFQIDDSSTHPDLDCPSPLDFPLDGPFGADDDDGLIDHSTLNTPHHELEYEHDNAGVDNPDETPMQTIVLKVDQALSHQENMDNDEPASPDFDPLDAEEGENSDSGSSASSYSPSKSKSKSKSTPMSKTPRTKTLANANGKFECPKCKKTFTKRCYRNDHIRYVHGRKIFKCPHCKHRSSKLPDLRRHANCQHPESTIPISRQTTFTEQSEEEEQSESEDEKSANDNKGGEENENSDSGSGSSYSPSKSRSRSKSRLKSTTWSRPTVPNANGEFECPECSKAFAKRYYLFDHIRYVHGKKIFKCPHCKHRSSKLPDLRRHVNCQHPESTIPISRQTTATEQSEEDEEEEDSDDNDEEEEDSDDNDEDAEDDNSDNDKDDTPRTVKLTQNDYGDSVLTVPLVQTESGEFPCQLCKKVYQTKPAVHSHLRLVHGPRNLRCPHCNYASAKMPDLRRHVRRRHPESTVVISSATVCIDGGRHQQRIRFVPPTAVARSSQSVSSRNENEIEDAGEGQGQGQQQIDDMDIDMKPNVNCVDDHDNVVSPDGGNSSEIKVDLVPNENGDFVCPNPKCNSSFARKNRLSDHMKYVHGPKNFRCPGKKCSYAASKLAFLQYHVNCRHPEITEPLTREQTLRTKIRRHRVKARVSKETKDGEGETEDISPFSNEEGIECVEEGEKGEDGEQKNETIKTIKGRKFKCTECSYATAIKSRLKRHSKVHRQPKKEPIGVNSLLCYICGLNLKSAGNLQLHLKRHAGRCVCTYPNCGVKFGIPSELKNHVLRVHEKSRHYLCPHCGRKLAHGSQFKRHLRTHTGERPFQCPHCPSAFMDKNTLVNHVGGLHKSKEERKYKCSQCEKSFVTSQDHKRHERIHSGIKPYECKFCKARFMDNKPLRLHVIRAHADEEFDPKNPSTYQGEGTDIGKKFKQKAIFLDEPI